MQATFASVPDRPRPQPDQRLRRTLESVRAGTHVAAALVVSEDMAADLGTAGTRRGEELAYVRARFVVGCRAAGVEAIDCLCTFRDARCCGRRALREEVPIYAVAKRLLATLNDR